ncbi:MAG: cobalamin B12-binding domain-containing protein [Acetobacteraceae bacterium]|nr:cobalamin B12-binding domain-containing protein [Pseudomonadota bacterium]
MSRQAASGWTPPNGAERHSHAALDRQQRASLLTRVVEAEILPRLAMLRAVNATPTEDIVAFTTTEDDNASLVRLLLGPDGAAAEAFIKDLQQRGATAVSLYLGVVTQAARTLGMLWEEDRCDFAEVTIGLGRLQQVVRYLSPEFQSAAINHPQPPNILLIPAPGEQHTFGLMIVAEFFQREGWSVTGGPATAPDEAVAIARETWIDVAGFTVASPPRLEGLATCIKTLRRVSRNRDLSIMVGGPLLLRQPEILVRIGADVCAPDALSAVRQASGLIALRTAAD